ncbi:MAG: ATP-binding protein [Candidatus Electrothrix communis]|nr:MAG: ATP-binding protein [Candidatus Electrothrix communis]
MFEFRNPGMMRIPVELALHGGYADCRNRLLHQMFRYVGIGDQSGSGISKILSCWHRYHWRAPELFDSREPRDQTMMRMRMIDLSPKNWWFSCDNVLGKTMIPCPMKNRLLWPSLLWKTRSLTNAFAHSAPFIRQTQVVSCMAWWSKGFWSRQEAVGGGISSLRDKYSRTGGCV